MDAGTERRPTVDRRNDGITFDSSSCIPETKLHYNIKMMYSKSIMKICVCEPSLCAKRVVLIMPELQACIPRWRTPSADPVRSSTGFALRRSASSYHPETLESFVADRSSLSRKCLHLSTISPLECCLRATSVVRSSRPGRPRTTSNSMRTNVMHRL